MQSKKEKNEQPGVHHPESILKLLPLLETPDQEYMESILNIIHENLCGTKDARLLNGIVDYYIATESQKSVDILLRLKDPHDKHLFDKISELMKNEDHRSKSLLLFMNLVYKQPSWLHKIGNHRIMNTLLNLLKNDVCAPNLMNGLLTLICLLPMIPSQFGHFLQDTFDIFSRLAAWGIKRPSSVIDVYMVHLHVAIYSLFHRLYGLFPCNFLAYLRSFYGGREYKEENFRVFSVVIKPMLERVRLHPLLVTGSKETELSTSRWKKVEYHDIMVECASVSLDFVEGTEESARNRTLTSSNEHNFSSLESAQVNCSDHSSCSISYEPENLNDSCNKPAWSPNNASISPAVPSVTSATSPYVLLKSKHDASNQSRQMSSEDFPLDIAVEAKPEILKLEMESSKSQTDLSKDPDLQVTNGGAFIESDVTNMTENKNILPAMEAKEEEIDREVCELTSQLNSTQTSMLDARHDTPFCSTTQTLTEKPGEASEAYTPGKLDTFLKTSEEDCEEMFSSIPDSEAEAFGHTFSRYRYFSHHGPPPDIPLCCAPKTKVARSKSCPENIYPPSEETKVKSQSLLNCHPTSVCNNIDLVTSSSAFVPVSGGGSISSSNRLLTYDKLLPSILNPATRLDHKSSSFSHKLSFSSLSPPELLDRYVQLGNITCLNQLNFIPITSNQNTDWTHFGGKPPPDEITILRNQIMLLHSQLLYERHRKNVHSERNRRILGRAKIFKMQEEHIAALMDQISLLEKDNRNLRSQLEKKNKYNQQVMIEKHQLETSLRLEISKVEQENTLLQFSNKEIKGLLVDQRKENDEIREVYKQSQSEITHLKHQVERANRKTRQCLKIEKDSIFLSKQLVLMQELISHYKDRMDVLKESKQTDMGETIMNNASLLQIEALKQMLESKQFQMNSTKTSLAHMDQLHSELKTKLREQVEALEKIKVLHRDEIEMRDERLKSLKSLSSQKDVHILSLYSNIESLTEEKRILENELNRFATDNKANKLQEMLQSAESPSCSENSIKTKTIDDGK